MRQSKDLGSFFELRAKNAPIYNSLPGHFYENLQEYFFVQNQILIIKSKQNNKYT